MIFAGILWPSSLKEDSLIERVRTSVQASSNAECLHLEKEFLSFFAQNPFKENHHHEIIDDDHHIIAGRVFHKKTFQPLSKKDLPLNFDNIWGSYIGISPGRVFRDPIGQIDFYYLKCPTGAIVFSSLMSILHHFLSEKPSYNWDYFKSYLLYSGMHSTQTPFEDIFELPPGCSLSVKESVITTNWIPASYYNSSPSDLTVAETLCETIRAWIRPYKNIVISLSGGLDSSSILFCLKEVLRSDQKLIAINTFHSEVRSSNEINYARQVCQEADVDLIEYDIKGSALFSPANPLTLKPNKPSSTLMSLKGNQQIRKRLSAYDPYIFVGGCGGDHLFMFPPSMKSITDYIVERGFRGVSQKILELSLFYRKSVATILRENISNLPGYIFRKHDNGSIHPTSAPWFTKEIFINTPNNHRHPQYARLSHKVVPGKRDQINNLSNVLAGVHFDERNLTTPMFYALLTQPLLELALSIPSYQLYEKGYDRYPLRNSISTHFKTNTVWRRNKGNNTGVLQLGVKENLNYILELVMEGQMAQQGLIQPDLLRAHIMRVAAGQKENLEALINVITIELYCRDWS